MVELTLESVQLGCVAFVDRVRLKYDHIAIALDAQQNRMISNNCPAHQNPRGYLHAFVQYVQYSMNLDHEAPQCQMHHQHTKIADVAEIMPTHWHHSKARKKYEIG